MSVINNPGSGANGVPITPTTIVASGLITGQANLQLGVAGSLSGVITLEGSTSGACTITAPAVAGTAANAIAVSNTINIPTGTSFSINGDTFISRFSAQGAGGVAIGTAINSGNGHLFTGVLDLGGTRFQNSGMTQYNGVNTAGTGLASVISVVDKTAQTALIGSTTLYAVPSSGTGQYRLNWNAKVTTAAGVSSTLGALTITYVDPDGTTQTLTCAGQSELGVTETTDTGNSTTTALLGIPLLLNCKASTNITYAFGYASNAAAAMNYNLHLRLEWM